MPPLRSEKLLQYSFWRFVDTQPIVRSRNLRTHFAYHLSSQLMDTVQLLLLMKGALILISFISESIVFWGDSPFKFSLLPPSCVLDFLVLAFGIVKLLQPVRPKECSRGTESFVGSSRLKQHLRPLCWTICECELYCLSKRSPHLIDQQVIIFYTF